MPVEPTLLAYSVGSCSPLGTLILLNLCLLSAYRTDDLVESDMSLRLDHPPSWVEHHHSQDHQSLVDDNAYLTGTRSHGIILVPTRDG